MKERLSEVSSRTTTSAANTTSIADMRVKLSILWVFMETAMVMVPLARLLKYRAKRWANVVAGILHTVAVIGSLFVTGKMPASYYIFFACVESVTTSIIVWNAWKWTEVQTD